MFVMSAADVAGSTGWIVEPEDGPASKPRAFFYGDGAEFHARVYQTFKNAELVFGTPLRGVVINCTSIDGLTIGQP